MPERRDYRNFYAELAKKKTDFNDQLQQFAEKLVPEACVDMTRLIGMNVYNGVTEKSPVDTGLFRASWNIVKGTEPDTSIAEDLSGNNDRSKSTMRAARELLDLKFGEAITVSNNVEYAGALERGHSQQAPIGVLGLTLDDIRLQLEAMSSEVLE